MHEFTTSPYRKITPIPYSNLLRIAYDDELYTKTLIIKKGGKVYD